MPIRTFQAQDRKPIRPRLFCSLAPRLLRSTILRTIRVGKESREISINDLENDRESRKISRFSGNGFTPVSSLDEKDFVQHLGIIKINRCSLHSRPMKIENGRSVKKRRGRRRGRKKSWRDW